MAKLYFRYSAMNSGKTTALIQAAHNYEERGMRVVVIKPGKDTKGGNKVTTRLGIDRQVDLMLEPSQSIRRLLRTDIDSASTRLSCVLVDEAQFLTEAQVDELFWIATLDDIPVLTYGLRTDFRTVGFPGSTRLLQMAHEIQEMKTICRCGRKAVLNCRKRNERFIFEGDQVAIDGEDSIAYESLCARCYHSERQNSVN